MKMVLASANPHKAEELARLLPGFDVQPYEGPLPPETGSSFLENALIKARAVHDAVGGRCWVLADDSGIQARALDGAPGIYSARYAGEGASDADNLNTLLAALADQADRAVAYAADLVAIAPDGRELCARGELRGTLAHEPRGSGGFGYDPAFVPEGETRTVAQMSAAEKDAISHRARAAGALLPLLEQAMV